MVVMAAVVRSLKAAALGINGNNVTATVVSEPSSDLRGYEPIVNTVTCYHVINPTKIRKGPESLVNSLF